MGAQVNRATGGADVLSSPRSLSFYKESLAGETDNYVHLRASAECKPATEVLRQLAAEVTETVRRIDVITASDAELAALWRRFLQVRVSPKVCRGLILRTRHLTVSGRATSSSMSRPHAIVSPSSASMRNARIQLPRARATIWSSHYRSRPRFYARNALPRSSAGDLHEG